MKLLKYLLIFLIFSIAFSQKYDPKTGELIQEQKYDPTTGELIKITKYDPVTGEPIEDIPALKSNNTTNVKNSETKINNSLNSPSYLSIITAAKAEAKLKNKSQELVNIGVGGFGCLFHIFGVPLASLYALSSTSQDANTNYYNNLSNENKTIYSSAYKSEVNRFKRNTVFGTMGAGLALFFIMIIGVGP